MANKILRTREAYEQHKQNIVQAKEDLNKILRSKADVQTPAGGTWYDEETEMKELLARSKIRKLEKELENMVIIEESQDTDTVGIGSLITLEISSNKTVETCTIKLIASTITDWDLEVSVNGPLGQAIISKKVNDEVVYTVDNTVYHAKILDIS